MDQYGNGKLTLTAPEARTVRAALNRQRRGLETAIADAYTETEKEFLIQERDTLTAVWARMGFGDFKEVFRG